MKENGFFSTRKKKMKMSKIARIKIRMLEKWRKKTETVSKLFARS